MSDTDKDDLFAADTDGEFGGFEADFGKSEPEQEQIPVASEGTQGTEESVPDPIPSEDSPSELEAGTVTNEEPSEETVTESPETVTESPETVTEPLAEHTGADTVTVQKKKQVRKPMTKKQKMLRVILRRAGLEKLPELSVLMRDKEGIQVAIREIALFIGEPKDEALAEISAKLPCKNTVNLSAEVMPNRVISVGADILRAGRMFQPVQLADILEDEKPTGNLQCTSGRHRLAFLALAYGVDAVISVYVENMTLNEARDAVVVANQARPTRARERAEHTVLGAVGGNADARQKELYEATATTKTKARKYCVYSVFDKKHPLALTFVVSQTSSRKDGGLTTVSNVENFWSAALAWEKGTSWKKYDAALAESIQFLNALVTALEGEEGFFPNHHLASMTLSAVGKWFRAYQEITGEDASALAPKVAKYLVAFGEIGRQKSEATYDALTQAMRS